MDILNPTESHRNQRQPEARINGTRWLERFLRVDPQDAGCAATFELLDRYVERQMVYGDAAQHFPGIAVHLQACRPCVEDFEGLLAALAELRPTQEEPMRDYPQTIVTVDHVEPVPRRVRATVAGRVVFDSTRALYVWEWPYYPVYYIPRADVNTTLLADEKHPQRLHRGASRRHALVVGDVVRPAAALVYETSTLEGLDDTVRFEWASLDHWYEEDEEVYVHPRNPYVRVDALRSTRSVRVSLEGVVLAESSSPVLVFETGLPTRYYLNPTEVHWEHLVATDTVTACPYKGETTGYWSVKVGDRVHQDLAWTYQYPTRQLLPITGLVAFYNEKVDIEVDGQLLPRPVTHFFKE